MQADTSSLATLPDEVLFHILSFLDARNLSHVQLVCSQMRHCASDESLWKSLSAQDFAQERGIGWLEKLKAPDQPWSRLYRQLAGCKFLVIFSGDHARGPVAMDALERDLKEHGLPQVAVMNGAQTQPTPDMLREYAAVMVTSDNAFMKDNRALGSLMAQYVDDGHGVVIGGFVACGCPITGRWEGDYDPISPAQSMRTDQPVMEVVVPDHPVLANVRCLRGNPAGETPYSPGHATGNTTTIAEWEFRKEEGEMLHVKRTPLVVEKYGLNGRVVGLNFTPTSSALPKDVISAHCGYDATTDGAQLMANALLYCALQPANAPAVKETEK